MYQTTPSRATALPKCDNESAYDGLFTGGFRCYNVNRCLAIVPEVH